MNIGVDTRELFGQKAGKGWYVFHVLKNILDLDSKNNYILYSDREIDFPQYRNAKIVIINKPGLIWHYVIAKRLKKDSVDLYWAPTSPIVPALTSIPTIMTIHDLTNLLFPAAHTLKGRIIEKIFLKRALAKTKKIIAISEATRKDLIRYFPKTKNQIEVIPLGYDSLFKPLPQDKIVKSLLKYSLDPGYVLFVGTIEPRKNIELLIDAFSMLPEKIKKQFPLVIVGKKGWLSEPIFKKMSDPKVSSYIKYLKYVDFADLPAVYNGASLFIFPSLYEGFGLPPLEAMACGKAVITSNLSSLPEVVGEAGILVNPKDKVGIKEKLQQLLEDQKYRKKIENSSLLQAKNFDWQTTAKKTLSVIDSQGTIRK